MRAVAHATREAQPHTLGGWHGGPPPFGYKIIDRRLVVEHTEAKWVKRIFTESLNGSSPQKTRTLLDANGGQSPSRGAVDHWLGRSVTKK
jgi:hypothetical protein